MNSTVNGTKSKQNCFSECTAALVFNVVDAPADVSSIQIDFRFTLECHAPTCIFLAMKSYSLFDAL